MPQVNKEEGYNFNKYGGVDRFASYAYQIREILSLAPQSVLEIGVGDGVVGNYVRSQTKIGHTWVDIAEDLNPDVIADIRKLPFEDNSFDVVCAFEVLEHLPFEDFETGLCEMLRVSKKAVLISLPHFGPPVKFLLKLPFVPEIKFAFKIPFPRQHQFNGQHYWEIGKRSHPASRIRTVLSKHGAITREFIPFENQYHHFFVLQKTS